LRRGVSVAAFLVGLCASDLVRAEVPAITRLAPAEPTGAARMQPVEAATPAARRPPSMAPFDAAQQPPAPHRPRRDLEPDQEREPSAFEQLATAVNGGRPVLRLGTEPRNPAATSAVPQRVPADYVLQTGDEVSIALWGSLDGQWTLRVDRAGRITLPRVGPVAVGGRSLQDLVPLLRQRLDAVFKDYQLSAAVTDASPVAVHVTGYVDRPGELVLPPLSTITTALAHIGIHAGAGSTRRLRLLRDDRPVVEFDLYQLLRTGSRRDDRLLQPGDVLHVEAAGAQVAVLGSVNRAAVLEILPGETVADALRLAGGLSPVADRGSLTLERMGQRHGEGPVLLQLPRDLGRTLEDGDLLRATASALVDGPTQLRNRRVRISGEVNRPGDYLLAPGIHLDEALALAGGATPSALLFGTALRRESVRRLQEQNYQRALRELETSLLEDSGRTAGAATAATAASAGAQANPTRDLLTRLRERQPEGRVVLDLAPDVAVLPPVPLEDGDQIHVPPRSQSVGVFGSVYNPGSFLHLPGRSVQDYLDRAGGPRERADASAAFVVRANGEVVASEGRWMRGGRLVGLAALPGDTVFVPELPPSSRYVQNAKDWTQVLYQLGLGVAALLAVR